MQISELPSITAGLVIQSGADTTVLTLLTDSRKLADSTGVVFFAVRGERHDGNQFVKSVYDRGVRMFVVEEVPVNPLPGAWIIQVERSVSALQQVAAHHRTKFNFPVIGVTGSNGKTIIKEWLYQLLSPDFRIAKNPGSYNSQIGVPLSVWQIQSHHSLGIFEAGISTTGEMLKLRSIIQPTLGIFTNIGSAHDEGFAGREEKVREKLNLFDEESPVIYSNDHDLVKNVISSLPLRATSWGFNADADIRVSRNGNAYTITTHEQTFDLNLPFSDQASVENALHCVATMLVLGYKGADIAARITQLRAIPMRLELKEGIQNCQIIDDTYNNDLAGLQLSLDFLGHQRQKPIKRVILSDVLQSGLPDDDWVGQIGAMTKGVDHLIGIGPVLFENRHLLPPGTAVFPSTTDFLNTFNFSQLHDEVILVKGARTFAFERIVSRLQRRVHGTILEIDLGALVHNLNYFRTLAPETRVMAMVKAFAYGSGSIEIANVLQYHKIDYLGVAYTDEGVDLRKNHITLPIMVMNPDEESFDALVKYGLEPEIYSFRVFDQLAAHLKGRPCKVHLKFDTGMHRLGFLAEDTDRLIERLQQHPNIRVASVFSHLVGADESHHDDFSRQQAERFLAMARDLTRSLGYQPLRHLLNSSGVLRFPDFRLDMVRVGIGLYGVDPTGNSTDRLRPVASLKTIISQIREIPAGDTVGYGRRGLATRKMKIATIAIGYADGYSRSFSQGVGRVLVRGKLAPVIGNVCMDMTMIDVTEIDAQEGDEVTVFGKDLPISDVAASIGTIPYEILTNTSERVRRVFIAESL